MSGVSSVLVGIMGGVMTIGLTMAGGSFLAPGFDQANVTAKAAQVLTAMQQTGAAAAMARTMDGDVGIGVDGVRRLVAQGWLSSMPRNPTGDQPADAPALMPAPDGTRYIQMPLFGDVDGRICDTVAKMTGLPGAPGLEAAPMAPTGCIRTSGGSVAFARS